MSKNPSNRIHGLDTLRAAAIILVYIFHLGFIAHKPVFDIGWIGVDLFFVLSGYLIGNQIFTAIAHKKTFSFKIFMIRRLWRTLPNYIVVLALYLWVDGFRDHPTLPPLWKMFICTALVSIMGGCILYTFIEKPSLYLRDKIYRKPKL